VQFVLRQAAELVHEIDEFPAPQARFAPPDSQATIAGRHEPVINADFQQQTTSGLGFHQRLSLADDNGAFPISATYALAHVPGIAIFHY
jgi:hypothetical protein